MTDRDARRCFLNLAQAASLALALLLPGAASLVHAQALPTSADAKSQSAAVAADSDAKMQKDFDELIKLSVNHPNELYRIYGAKAAAAGQWRDAVRMFKIAASYADKYSQHRLSLLYWHGIGTRQDRVEAYIWSDLAAERGYLQFLAIRERIWQALTPEQQAQVPARGAAMYKRYGDPAAKKRFATALAQGKRKITGSHTGFFNNLAIISPGVGNDMFASIGGVDLNQMYDASRTDPDKYWAFEDYVWKNASVTVGDPETLKTPAETGTEQPR